MSGQICGSTKKGRGIGSSTRLLRECILDVLAEGDAGAWTVRQVFYAVTVAGGTDKSEAGYRKVQRQVLEMRRAGLLHYTRIADNTRWVRRIATFDRLEDWIDESLSSLRIDLWRGSGQRCEVWIEKDALAGVIDPVTARWHVPLFVTRGYASETFAYEAAHGALADRRPFVVLYLGDFDASGVHMARDLERRLTGFMGEHEYLMTFQRIAVTPEQIDNWSLPSRPNKITDTRNASFEAEFPGYEATELDAIRPDRLRELVETNVTALLDPHAVERVQDEERDARALARRFADQIREARA